MLNDVIELAKQIKEDWDVHERDWTRPGFRAVAVHRFGNWRMKVRPILARAPLSVVYRVMERHCRNHYGIELPYSAKLGRRVKVEHQGAIVVHGASVIGDDVILRQGVTLGMRSVERANQAPVIGNGVDIGAGAKLLGGIHVGDKAAIGANAVVLEDVPAGALAVGVPAKIVDRRRKKSKETSSSHPAAPVGEAAEA